MLPSSGDSTQIVCALRAVTTSTTLAGAVEQGAVEWHIPERLAGGPGCADRCSTLLLPVLSPDRVSSTGGQPRGT